MPASLCGMNASDKWSLIANYFDDTKLLDKLAMDLSGEIGMEYYIRSDWVDLYINDEYVGNYLLTREPDISSEGLDIGNLEKLNDLHYEERNCGFSSGSYYFTMKSPNNASMDEIRYIQSFVKTADESIHDGGDKTHYIDPDSFIRRYLVNTFFNDDDTNIASYFFYKKRGGDVLYAGPCWDYDMPSFHDYTIPLVRGIRRSGFWTGITFCWDISRIMRTSQRFLGSMRRPS